MQTLAHRRFEAKALYYIDTVLVVEYDEFLYCAVVSATASAQGEWINSYLSQMKAISARQVELTQGVVANRTASPRGCVAEKAAGVQSIFDCSSSYLFYNGAHSVKSVHLNHSLLSSHRALQCVSL